MEVAKDIVVMVFLLMMGGTLISLANTMRRYVENEK